MYPFTDGAGVFQVVVEHRVANVDGEVQEARNLGYYRRHLRAMVRGLLAIQGTPEPASQHAMGLRRETLLRTASRSLVRSTLSQYGLTSSQPDAV